MAATQTRWAYPEVLKLWRLAWPIFVGKSAPALAFMIDAVMAAQSSTKDLALVAVGSAVWTIMVVTFIGWTQAVGPLVAQAVGGQKRQRAALLVQQAWYQGLFFALLVLAAVQGFGPFFRSLEGSAWLARSGHEFLSIASWGLPAVVLYRVLYAYNAALGASKPMMVIAFLELAFHIPTAWVLIHGHLGVSALGPMAFAWRKVMFAYINVLLLGGWVVYHAFYQDSQPFRHWSPLRWAVQGELLRLGFPMAAAHFLKTLFFSGSTLLIATLGVVPVAAHHIVLAINKITFRLYHALSLALTVRVGHAVGAGDAAQARCIGRLGLSLGLGIAAVVMVFLMLGRDWIASLYSNNPTIWQLSAHLMLYLAVFQLADALTNTTTAILNGYKIAWRPMYVTLAAFWIIAFPMGLVLTFGFGRLAGQGVAGYWQALMLALIFSGLSLLWIVMRATKSQRLLPLPCL